MKKIINFALFLLAIQYGFATEKDSLMYQKYFKYIFLNPAPLEDDCDACGCAASGGSMGFASMLNTNFVGIRYFNQSYRSTDGLYSNSPWYTENFNTLQVWARFPVSKNIQVSALFPYQFHNRQSATGKQEISGIGDATLIGMYTLLQTTKDSANVYHTLQLGGGVKIPLGKFDASNNGSVNPSYQVGTGSWDYLLASEYVIKRKKVGLNTMLNYIIKTENEKNYRFGNQFNYAATLFYLIENNKFSMVPQLGFAGEVYETNYQLNQRVRGTAGDIFMGKMGIELGKNKFSVGTSLMLPIN
ncbi:MAG TPA: hypothetical protein DDZ41_00170, partial [Flavobacterium sp.]|nr:hypothetical protein [Flavobacterium sp.]